MFLTVLAAIGRFLFHRASFLAAPKQRPWAVFASSCLVSCIASAAEVPTHLTQVSFDFAGWLQTNLPLLVALCLMMIFLLVRGQRLSMARARAALPVGSPPSTSRAGTAAQVAPATETDTDGSQSADDDDRERRETDFEVLLHAARMLCESRPLAARATLTRWIEKDGLASRRVNPESAARLAIHCGAEFLRPLIKGMDESTCASLFRAIATVRRPTDRTTDADVLRAFLAETKTVSHGQGDSVSLLAAIEHAELESSRLAGEIRREISLANYPSLQQLSCMSGHDAFALLQDEHPQVLALAASLLGTDDTVLLLSLVEEPKRAAIFARFIALDIVSKRALGVLDTLIRSRLDERVSLRRFGGERRAVQLLRGANPAAKAELLAALDSIEPDARARLEGQLINFTDIADCEDRIIQAVLRELPTRVIAVALHGAEPRVVDCFLNNLPARAADMLREDCEMHACVDDNAAGFARDQVLSVLRQALSRDVSQVCQ